MKTTTEPSIAQVEQNIPKLYLFTFLHMFVVLLPVVVPFFESRGLNMQQVYEIQAIFALSVVIFEVPSGYLADLLGRKLVMNAGAMLGAIGFFLLAYAEQYREFFVAELTLGIGFAMVSGADLSLLYDSALKLNRTTSSLGNLTFFNSLGEAAAAVLGGWIAAWSLRYAAFGSACSMLLAFVVGLTVVEIPREKTSAKHWQNIILAGKELLGSGLDSVIILLNYLFCSLITYILVWVLQKFWIEREISIAYVGYLWAAFNLVVALSAKFAARLEWGLGWRASYMLVPLFYLVGLLGMGYAGGILGVLLGIFLNAGRGISTVLLKDAINAQVRSEFRATVNSLMSLFVRLGYCVLGPLVGYFADVRDSVFVFRAMAVSVALGTVLLVIPLVVRRPT